MESGLTTGWIIGLCLSVIMAVIGWTVSISQALRMRVFQKVEKDLIATTANVAANNIRISVLENKYDIIQSMLHEIKALLMTHLDKK
jgi:hypothetical protein